MMVGSYAGAVKKGTNVGEEAANRETARPKRRGFCIEFKVTGYDSQTGYLSNGMKREDFNRKVL